MSTDRELLKQAQSGHIGSIGATAPITVVSEAHSAFIVFHSASAAAFAETGIYIPFKCKVTSCKALPSSALATDGTNYITGTLAKRDGAGGSATTIATFTTNSTGGSALAAFVPEDMPVSATAGVADIAAGQVLTFKTVDAGVTTEPLLTVTVTVEFV